MNILLLGDINLEYIKSNLNIDYNYFTNYEGNNENIKIIVVRGSNFSLKKDYLENIKELKYIYVLGIGMDNIDLEYCNKNDILVSNEPTISTYSVAELTVGMLIMGLRQVFITGNNLKNGEYNRYPIGNNLIGKKIGILGYGNIGKTTTKLLNGFKEFKNFEIFVYDKNSLQYDNFLIENNIKKFDNLNTFIENIDYLVIHTWGGEENKDLINKKLLEKSKIKGIINTARKGIINENELIELLDNDILDFYITDVIEGEPKINNISKKLLKNKKVFVTPHIGANTYQIQKSLLDSLINKIKKGIK